MGSTLHIKCRSCDYALDAPIGIGMQYMMEWLNEYSEGQKLLRELLRSDAEYKRVRALIDKNGENTVKSYGHWLYSCQDCGHLCERFYICLDCDDSSYQPQYRCPTCKEHLYPVQEDIIMNDSFDEEQLDFKHIPCPKCKSLTLYHDNSSCCLWD